MKKFGYVIAALGAIAIAAPSIASAETVVIKRGGHHHGYMARAPRCIAITAGIEGWRHRQPTEWWSSSSAITATEDDTGNGPARGHFLVRTSIANLRRHPCGRGAPRAA